MKSRIVIAALQTNAGPEIEPNLEKLAPMIRTARERGAEFITLPENVSLMVMGKEKLYSRVRPESEHPAVTFFANMAKETGAWILAGSIAVTTDHDRLANRSYLFNPNGKIAAHYDKIHMFDADLDVNETYRESAHYRGGNCAVLSSTPWGKIGLTICYDVRFPHLYRTLAKAGAQIITVPAAFAATTGRMHWHVLLRARAIETGCFIVAPGQCGQHDGGRLTYGHSLIVAPSGEIIAEAGEEPDIIVTELDLSQVAVARRRLPSLQHDCDFEMRVLDD
ncbi:MAG: carbon-nitrogen hydrolase family protein [Alphaproteobacteria bacterium]|nr:carbon-nitrogen hydrolase family protein [Alphaproteobacteria bacterium]